MNWCQVCKNKGANEYLFPFCDVCYDKYEEWINKHTKCNKCGFYGKDIKRHLYRSGQESINICKECA